MKKRKTYEISVIDKTYSKTISDKTNYLMKGMLSKEVFNEVMQSIENIKNPPEYEELPE